MEVADRMAATFEPMARRAVAEHGLPGLVVGVVAEGRLAWSGAWGVRRIGGADPLTPRSLFHMASVTKPFVGTAVMQLVEQGKVDLDAPVVRYLPYFQLADTRASAITVRQMLSHTSGMPDVKDYEWEKAVADEGALERYVRGLGNEQLIAAPGERFRYSNMAYEVLGHLVAKVSGETFEAYVKAHILAPLGMKDSTIFRPEADPALTTTPHVLDGQLEMVASAVYPYNRMHGPSSTLHSNVPDMARFALANLRRGELDGRRILRTESYDVLWKPTGDASLAGGDQLRSRGNRPAGARSATAAATRATGAICCSFPTRASPSWPCATSTAVRSAASRARPSRWRSGCPRARCPGRCT